MSKAQAVRELLAGLPIRLGAQATVRKLNGGLNNDVFRISGEDGDFVLRLGHKQAGLPDISCELSILRDAAKAGLGPDVEYADPSRGILLLRFVQGRTWEREDLLLPGNIGALAGLLRDVHALPSCGTEFDIAGIAEKNLRTLYRRDELRHFGSDCLRIVREEIATDSRVCCHNDVVAGNLVAGDRLKLIDWEWAADNEPMFDLASIVAYHDLGTDLADTLLGTYAGGADALLRERYWAQARLFDALQWLWLAARETRHPDVAQVARLGTLQSRIGA